MSVLIPSSPRQLSCNEIEEDECFPPDCLAAFVKSELAPLIPERAQVISFDGLDGVGKSTLAAILGQAISVPAIGLDDFLTSNQGHFLDALRIDELKAVVEAHLAHHKRIIVEGCLVQSVLERLCRPADFSIYVMRTSRMRSGSSDEWVRDDEILFGPESAAELITTREKLLRRWKKMPTESGGGGDGELPGLERELIHYHKQKRPHDQADIIVKVVHWS